MNLQKNSQIPTQVLVLGDSHVAIFRHACFTTLFPHHAFAVIAVPGATVSGLENPNSATQALPIFKAGLQASHATTAVVMLGEVDVGFVIWFRSEKYGAAVQDMLKLALHAYQDFLREVQQTCRVVCISTPLPTISDSNDWGEVSNRRKEVKATQDQRTQLTLQFNAAMQAACRQLRVDYVMLDAESMGADGLVCAELRNSNPLDHHYDAERYAALLAQKLKPLLLSSL